MIVCVYERIPIFYSTHRTSVSLNMTTTKSRLLCANSSTKGSEHHVWRHCAKEEVCHSCNLSIWLLFQPQKDFQHSANSKEESNTKVCLLPSTFPTNTNEHKPVFGATLIELRNELLQTSTQMPTTSSLPLWLRADVYKINASLNINQFNKSSPLSIFQF